MPVVLAGDNVLVTINGTLFGQRIMNTFGYVVSSVTGGPQDDDLLTAFRNRLCAGNELVDKYLACLPDEYVIGSLWFQIVRPTRYIKRVLGNTATGLKSGLTAGTANIAGVITRRGDVGNRKNVSTLHVPAPSHPDWVDGGTLTLQALNAYADLAVKVKTSYTTTGFVANFYPSIFNKPTAADVTPITEAFVMDSVRIMRRRTVGLGI